MRTNLSKIAQAATLGLAMTFTLSCSSGGDGDGGSSSSVGGGHSSGGDSGGISSSGGGNGSGSCGAGETVVIGSQTWMKRNLNCNVSGSKCYNNDEANCAKYGRLYDWETAKTACPSGWHLPSDAEWTTLTDYVEAQESCTSCAGKYLKSTSGWNNDGNGADSYGFSALPGGLGRSDGSFSTVGNHGYWWSASEYDDSLYAYYRYMVYNYEYVDYYGIDKSRLYSVRCLQD
jgi:uncharacterized protein (TIGR02145 family)